MNSYLLVLYSETLCWAVEEVGDIVPPSPRPRGTVMLNLAYAQQPNKYQTRGIFSSSSPFLCFFFSIKNDKHAIHPYA